VPASLIQTIPAARETNLLFERLQPAPRLVICGAGHVGASLARLAAFAGYHTTLVDDRADFLNRERFPEQEIDLMVAKRLERGVTRGYRKRSWCVGRSCDKGSQRR
jgi:xanthine dehydrogenase accessory factor